MRYELFVNLTFIDLDKFKNEIIIKTKKVKVSNQVKCRKE